MKKASIGILIFSIFLILLLILIPDSENATSNISLELRINEICSSNYQAYHDEKTGYSDYIELYNPTNQDIILDDYYLTQNLVNHSDSLSVGNELTGLTISAHDYLIVTTGEKGNVGLRIAGGSSRGYNQKSLKLFSRKALSGKSYFSYDFFGDYSRLKSLLLCWEFRNVILEMADNDFEISAIDTWIDNYTANYGMAILQNYERFYGDSKDPQSYFGTSEQIRSFFHERKKYLLEELDKYVPVE